jgi:hypothetical protein
MKKKHWRILLWQAMYRWFDAIAISLGAADDYGAFAVRWRKLFYFAPLGFGAAVLAVEYEQLDGSVGPARRLLLLGRVEELYGEFVHSALR